MRWPRFIARCVQLVLGTAVMAACAPASAKEEGGIKVDPTGQIEFRLVESDLAVDQGEGFDSSGVAFRAEAGLDFDLGKTTGARVEVEGGYYDYSDPIHQDRTSYGGAIELRQELSEAFEIRLRFRRIENIALLESTRADQTSVGVRLQWEHGNDRLRAFADYRWREYDLSDKPKGKGWRFAGQYNRRFGSYHWLRFDLAYEEIDSDTSPARAYDRTTAKVEYSHPIAKRLRLKPSVEYRSWSYDARIARGDPQGELRQDSYVGPALELSYGSDTRGFYAEANAQYRLRTSNDVRYDHDAFRVGVTAGFRF
ncbi:hypothetical protein LY632_02695 [Erythrobacter sp. SDW2]|uniref:hypothetical protein n=1 Tax=Erythrobacter sp. SDW2 TaxID=2907154 RepID=UPI001F3BF0A9|nr:hypothetical protein [Erythrobacter sp. SDW2]UIP07327.1 hypothetical protein LY632_02695 [Erythrobacter sp. SDW2]